MPRTSIPSGITGDDVLQAISDLKAGNVAHEFHESERYDLIHEGERFAPKAVLGVAARRVAGRLLTPADFSGREGSKCFRVLRSLGFTVEKKPGAAAPTSLTFEVGKEYNRRDEIHAPFGGQERGGTATPANYAAVFLFTGDSGGQFGYQDEFRADGVFLHTGEGQAGDMKWAGGNLAVMKSPASGERLLLFEENVPLLGVSRADLASFWNDAAPQFRNGFRKASGARPGTKFGRG